MKNRLLILILFLVTAALVISGCSGEPASTLTPPPGSTTIPPLSPTPSNKGGIFSTKDPVLGLVLKGNDLWATTSKGVIRWNPEIGNQRKYTTQDGLASNQVREIVCDLQGNIWVTNYVSGVSRFNGEKWDTFKVKNGLCSDDPIALAADLKGGVWVSAYWGVSYFNGQKWSSYSNHSPDALVVGGENPMKDCQNMTIVGGELEAVDHIFVDSRENVWFSSRGRGITRYDGKEWRVFTTKDGLGSGGCNLIFEDKQGTFWFDSTKGITSFDGVQFIFLSIPAFQPIIPVPMAQDILQDNQGNIWLAAYGGGVVKFDGKDWQGFSVQDGLPSINAQDLFLTRQGLVGVITDKGVCTFDGSSWKALTEADGLPEGNIRVVISDDKDNLWFGGDKGVAYYSK
jgi:ligand-binding sensor domain-containing protein